MSIYREQGQQGFVLDDDLVEQNLHFTFSASSEEKEHGRLPEKARSFTDGLSVVKRHTKAEMWIRIRRVVRSRATAGWPNNLWL